MSKLAGFGVRAVLTLGAMLAGCAAEVEGNEARLEFLSELPETVTTPKGREFLRLDLWSPAERERMSELSRASLGASPTLEEVAEGLRGYMRHHNGGTYIERDLNYPLARLVMEEAEHEVAGPSTEGGSLEPRTIVKADWRTNISSSGNNCRAATAFNEQGCSGTRIGADTLVTAAHCLYRTIGGNGWYCEDGSVGNPNCSSGNPPDWRFGVNGTSGHSNWVLNCGAFVVPGNYVDVDSSTPYWDKVRHDYAVWDLSACSSSYFPNGKWWEGTTVLDNTALEALTGFAVGYPFYATCPWDTTKGDYWDCPGPDIEDSEPNFQYVGNYLDNSYTGAELWEDYDSDVFAGGGGQSAYTIKFETDVTLGQSGGMLYRKTGTSTRHLVGIINSDEPSPTANYNAARRWTQSLHDWVATYSDFPNDT